MQPGFEGELAKRTQPASSRPSARSRGPHWTAVCRRWQAGLGQSMPALAVDRVHAARARPGAGRRRGTMPRETGTSSPRPSGRRPACKRSLQSPPWAPTPGARIHRSGASGAHAAQRLGVGGADHQAEVVAGIPVLRPAGRPLRSRRSRPVPVAPARSRSCRSPAPGLEVLHSRKTPCCGSARKGSSESCPR